MSFTKNKTETILLQAARGTSPALLAKSIALNPEIIDELEAAMIRVFAATEIYREGLGFRRIGNYARRIEG